MILNSYSPQMAFMKSCDGQTYLYILNKGLVISFVRQTLLIMLEKHHEGNPSSLLGNNNTRMLLFLSTPSTLAPLFFCVLGVTQIEKSRREVMRKESFKGLRHCLPK